MDAVPFTNVVRPPGEGPYACPCCRYVTLSERGGYEICPVCCWEDDGQDEHDATEVRGGPNYSLSLSAARARTSCASELSRKGCFGTCDHRSAESCPRSQICRYSGNRVRLRAASRRGAACARSCRC